MYTKRENPTQGPYLTTRLAGCKAINYMRMPPKCNSCGCCQTP